MRIPNLVIVSISTALILMVILLSFLTSAVALADVRIQTNTQPSTTIFVPFIASDSDTDSPTGNESATLEQQREIWASQNITNYQFQLEVSDFLQGRSIVTVRDGAVISVTDPETDTPLYESWLKMTIDEFFGMALFAQNRKADVVTVEVDPEYGFPTSVYIDYVDTIETDQLHYTITEFTVLPFDPTWQSTVERQQEIWANQNIIKYQFKLRRTCLCDGPHTATIAIRDSKVLSVTNSETGEPLDNSRFQLAIEDVFAKITDAQENDVDMLTVEYDPDYGFPTTVFIDREGERLNVSRSGDDMRLSMSTVADDEIRYTVSEFVVLPLNPLEQQREIWASQNITNYQFQMEVSFLHPQRDDKLLGGRSIVTVRDSAIISVTDPDTGTRLSDTWLKMTVDELFDVALDAQMRKADVVTVEADLEYGYPATVYIDYVDTIETDQLYYTVTQFSVLPFDPTWKSTVERQQEIWASQNITNYQFQLQTSCFCAPQVAIVTVQDSAVISVTVTRINTGESVEVPGFQTTIEYIFKRIRGAQNERAGVAGVQYDSEYGFPKSTFIDHRPTLAVFGTGDEIRMSILEIADSGIGYLISEFTPLP